MAADVPVDDSEALCTSLRNRLKSAFSSSGTEEEAYGQQAIKQTPIHPLEIGIRNIDIHRTIGIDAIRRLFYRRPEHEASWHDLRIFGWVLGAILAIFIGLLIAFGGVL